MSDPFLGEIRMFSFGFAPRGWAWCDGQFLPINQNQALFALLGTMYGGDGRVNFRLPDLRRRVPIHFDGVYPLGMTGGREAVTLTVQNLPVHAHPVRASSAPGTTDLPTGVPAVGGHYGGDPAAAMAPGLVPAAGGSQPVSIVQPYRVIGFCIALQGIFPSPS